MSASKRDALNHLARMISESGIFSDQFILGLNEGINVYRWLNPNLIVKSATVKIRSARHSPTPTANFHICLDDTCRSIRVRIDRVTAGHVVLSCINDCFDIMDAIRSLVSAQAHTYTLDLNKVKEKLESMGYKVYFRFNGNVKIEPGKDISGVKVEINVYKGKEIKGPNHVAHIALMNIKELGISAVSQQKRNNAIQRMRRMASN